MATPIASEPSIARIESKAKPVSGVKSAAAEIDASLPVADDFEKLLDGCDQIANGLSVFADAKTRIFPVLNMSWQVYQYIKEDHKKHQRMIDRLKRKYALERSPSLKKPIYNSICFACHPDGPEDWSCCSDWTNVLRLAEIKELSLADFPDWLAKQKIGEAKRQVRALKRVGKPRCEANRKLKLPFNGYEFPILARVLAEQDGALLCLLKKKLAEIEKLLADARGGALLQ